MTNFRLRYERTRRGYKPDDMARIIGLSHGNTYMIKERGGTCFKPKDIIAIAKEFNLTLDEVNYIFFDNQLPNGKVENAK